MRKKIVLGDIFEIETSAGLAYFQYVGNTPLKMDIIRILPGLYSLRPQDLSNLADEKEQFFIQFLCKKAEKMGLIKYVGNRTIENVEVPRFYRDYATFQEKGWEIIDISNLKRRYVEELSEDERKLSPDGAWNDTLLKERLAAGWKLENWK